MQDPAVKTTEPYFVFCSKSDSNWGKLHWSEGREETPATKSAPRRVEVVAASRACGGPCGPGGAPGARPQWRRAHLQHQREGKKGCEGMRGDSPAPRPLGAGSVGPRAVTGTCGVCARLPCLHAGSDVVFLVAHSRWSSCQCPREGRLGKGGAEDGRKPLTGNLPHPHPLAGEARRGWAPTQSPCCGGEGSRPSPGSVDTPGLSPPPVPAAGPGSRPRDSRSPSAA